MSQNIQNHKIEKIIFKNDRWHVVLDAPWNGRRQMPRANYEWLKANPAFIDIPKGYIVHHLDWDQLNDDPSNLALMHKHQHTAHHWKNKKIETDVKVHLDYQRCVSERYYPNQKPKINYDKARNCWYLTFYEGKNGGKSRRRIYAYNGTRFDVKETAEKARDHLWHGMVELCQQNTNGESCNAATI